ncbi:hypothetical protein WR25_09628 [Diploscapter pachys]|uniref:Uncharacterized protein n=1 Tax=Diploscapter pachys TaxID=2018661 RepID=A0A2A2J548_9BILA|nr:hypothetical protein WR25_09628 [Diploscapter pachys]
MYPMDFPFESYSETSDITESIVSETEDENENNGADNEDSEAEPPLSYAEKSEKSENQSQYTEVTDSECVNRQPEMIDLDYGLAKGQKEDAEVLESENQESQENETPDSEHQEPKNPEEESEKDVIHVGKTKEDELITAEVMKPNNSSFESNDDEAVGETPIPDKSENNDEVSVKSEKPESVMTDDAKENSGIAEERRHLMGENQQSEIKTITDFEQLPPPPTLPTGGLTDNVESVLIGNGLTNPSGAIVLPDSTVLVTDLQQGVLVFDFGGNVVNRITSEMWKNPRSPVYHKEQIFFIVDYKGEDNQWERYIIKYSADLQYIAKIEGPKWLKEYTVWREKLAVAHTDYLYLNVCGEIFSGLYELSPEGRWVELEYKLSESWTDMIAFATIGPITQLLVIEGRKNYVIMLSIRESEVVDRRRMAICERPGALAKDEAGRLFVANRFLASIQLVDTLSWASSKNVAICDAMIQYFSVSWGLVVIPLKNAIRLHRYQFR